MPDGDMVAEYHSFLVPFDLFGTILYPSNLTATHYLGMLLKCFHSDSVDMGYCLRRCCCCWWRWGWWCGGGKVSDGSDHEDDIFWIKLYIVFQKIQWNWATLANDGNLLDNSPLTDYLLFSFSHFFFNSSTSVFYLGVNSYHKMILGKSTLRILTDLVS